MELFSEVSFEASPEAIRLKDRMNRGRSLIPAAVEANSLTVRSVGAVVMATYETVFVCT